MKKYVTQSVYALVISGAFLLWLMSDILAPGHENATVDGTPTAEWRMQQIQTRATDRLRNKTTPVASVTVSDDQGNKIIPFPGGVIHPNSFREGAEKSPAPVRVPEHIVMVHGAPAHPSRVLVRVRPGVDPGTLETTLKSLDATADDAPNAGGWMTVNLPTPDLELAAQGCEIALLTGLKALQASGAFASTEPDYLVTHSATPSDAAYVQGWLWGLQNDGQSGGTEGVDVGALTAWTTTTGSTNLIVAVIDTGIRYTHQDLTTQMWRNPGEIPGNNLDDDGDGYVDNVYGIDTVNFDSDPMDDNGHGTHCAGTIGAAANDGHTHVGVAWQVQLMALKFLSADGWGYTSGAVECIDFAVANGARILSNSWGGGGFSQALYDSIAAARDAGVLFIAAAGNSGENTDHNPMYPAGYDLSNVISVAAIDRSGALAGWSNYGSSTVDIGAPGVDIFSTISDSDNAYAYFSGTSMATPHVSGVVALIMAVHDTLDASAVKARLLNTSRTLDSLEGRTVSGGLAHAGDAVGDNTDGNLELSVTVSETPLRGGRPATVFARVTDVNPVLNATVSGQTGYDPLTFADDGIAPDLTAADGIYSASFTAPEDRTIDHLTLSVLAEAPAKHPATASLNLEVIHPPANDLFEESAGLLGRRVWLTGHNNRAATAENGEPRHYYFKPQKSVWFTWTAPRNGRADLWLRGSDFDTILAVYRGGALSSLRRMARDDDSGGRLTSRARFQVRRGRTYHFAIDGWNGAEGEIDGRLVVRKRKPFQRSRRWWQWN